MAKKRKAEPIPNATGTKVPGAGGARKTTAQVRDVVEEIESRPERELDEQQAGDEPW